MIYDHIYALRQADGRYRFYDGFYQRTYSKRQELRAAGAVWDPKLRCWTGSLEAVRQVRAELLHRVRLAAHCHELEGEGRATEEECAQGFVIRGCMFCDTPDRCGDKVQILEDLGEE